PPAGTRLTVIGAAKGRPAGEQIARRRAGPSLRQPVRRSPLGERHDAAPAERYSAKAIGAARGHSRTGLVVNAGDGDDVPAPAADHRRRGTRTSAGSASRPGPRT